MTHHTIPICWGHCANFKLKERLCVAFKLDCKDIFRFFAVQINLKINFTCLIKPDLLVL